jgi:hypothetical protein
MWGSQSFGADVIAFDYTSEGYIVGTYYVAVYAYEETSFSVSVTAQDISGVDPEDVVSALVDGTPQTGLISQDGAMHYYTFFKSAQTPASDLTISVTPIYGDPDLYVSTQDLPTVESYTWSSGQWGRDSLTISATDPDFCQDCMYLIGVRAYSHTLYSIVASSETGTTRLQFGIPAQGTVQEGNYQYYSFTVLDPTQAIVISLTSLTGDPDLFVSDTARPTEDNYRWVSEWFGSDVVTIEADELSTGEYYIGVYGFETSSFVLTVSTSSSSVTLIPGQPQSDAIQAGESLSYNFHFPQVPKDTDISLVLQFSYGSAVMYVSTQDEGEVGPDNFEWSSTEVNGVDSRNTLTILTSDPAYCRTCTYRVSVVGIADSAFTITVTFGNQPFLLSTGHPLDATVAAGDTRYFFAFVDSPSDITIDATMYLGTAIMYVSTSASNPGPNDYEYMSIADAQGLHVFIPQESSQIGTYYVAVVASTETRMSIVFSTSGSLLPDGRPVYGVLPAEGQKLYFFYMAQPADFRLDLIEVTGSNVQTPTALQVFISTTTTSPSANDNQWYKLLAPGQHMVILTAEPNACSDCTYYISVVGSAGDEYELRATAAADFAVVTQGSFAYGSVIGGEYNYYETFVDTAANFDVLLETCRGNADLFMSQSTFTPDVRTSTWQSTNPNAVDRITIQDSSMTHVGFYIGVYGRLSGVNDYRLIVHSEDQDHLIAYSPVPGDNGHLTLEQDGTDLIITFSSATSALGETLHYTAYYTRAGSDICMFSKCGLDLAFRSASITVPSDGMTRNLQLHLGEADGLTHGHNYHINVAVVDDSGRFAVYGWEILHWKESDTFSTSDSFVWIAVPVSLVLLGVTCYLCVRNRRLKQRRQQDDWQILGTEMDSATPAINYGQMTSLGPPSSSNSTRNAMDIASEYLPPTERTEEQTRNTYAHLLADD